MKLYYADHFVLPLPEGHRFPMEKYVRLREKLASSGQFSESDFIVPPPATDSELLQAHDRDYLDRVIGGRLSSAEQRRIGFPWTLAMVERSRRSVGATLSACRTALHQGCAANLAGGTHHAHRDTGSGFCVFNDAATAALVLRAEGLIDRVAVVDCDVHQGDGTAAILAGDPDIFTFSIHGARNFPFHKESSDLDIELPDGTDDAPYLDALSGALETIVTGFRPELIIYLAGADPFRDDRLGRLSLTFEGLAQRDRMVLDAAHDHGIPIAIAMAGGYAHDISDTVAIHATTILTAASQFAPAQKNKETT